jgi:hypothetical protein
VKLLCGEFFQLATIDNNYRIPNLLHSSTSTQTGSSKLSTTAWYPYCTAGEQRSINNDCFLMRVGQPNSQSNKCLFAARAVINVRDYKSVSQLADYLKYLSCRQHADALSNVCITKIVYFKLKTTGAHGRQLNYTAYMEYHAWRTTYRVRLKQTSSGVRKLCELVCDGGGKRNIL